MRNKPCKGSRSKRGNHKLSNANRLRAGNRSKPSQEHPRRINRNVSRIRGGKDHSSNRSANGVDDDGLSIM